MRTALIALVSGISLAVFCAPAIAQQLPKSGKFTIHSGFKAVGETVQPAEGRVYGAGFFWGVAFNDKGAGPLHNGPAVCSYTLEMIGSALTAKGQCTWSDPDGDKIFNDYTGAIAPSGLFEGVNQFTGGTGKYSRIQGKAPFHCKVLGANLQYACTQEFEYQLP